jgi:hypothetical protein
MIHLAESIKAWDTPAFKDTLRREIEALDVGALPLQQGLTQSSYTADKPFTVMLIGVAASDRHIQAKAGIFFSGLIPGCACADDPTPEGEYNEYCVMEFVIDRQTGATRVMLLSD